MQSPKKSNTVSDAARIISIAEKLGDVLKQTRSIHGFDREAYLQIKQLSESIVKEIKSGLIRIAVVGSIKSGKSTFVNSYLNKETVKRGAGVMTAITTRIRKGRKNQANVHFKSWDDVNNELKNVLTLFPEPEYADKDKTDQPHFFSDSRSFDLRRKNDRLYLDTVARSMANDPIFRDEIHRPEYQVINQALNGYEVCKEWVKADKTSSVFQSKEFHNHQIFTAVAENAFYVSDVELEIYGNLLDPQLEIADCQGADSTDPAQLAKVLEYIGSANQIIYCISSRTGLRQADVTLLKRIKNLGLIEQVIFINNCDFSEHEDLEDLKQIEKRMIQDLSLQGVTPKIYSFSILFNLFSCLKSRLKIKDSARLKLWLDDKKMTRYGQDQSDKFNRHLAAMLDRDRQNLLHNNHINRLEQAVNYWDQQVDQVVHLCSSDRLLEQSARHKIDKRIKTAIRLEPIIQDSLNKVLSKTNVLVKKELNHFFAEHGLKLLNDTTYFIDNIPIHVDQYKTIVKESGFQKILYLIFRDFKQQLDIYTLENIIPDIKKMIRSLEEKIGKHYNSLLGSYQFDFYDPDLILGSDLKMTEFLPDNEGKTIERVDLERIKNILGLSFPEKIFSACYTPAVRLNVFSHFLYRFISQFAETVLRKKSVFSFSPVLEKTALKMKNENKRKIKSDLNQLKDNLLKTYFVPLTEAGNREIEEVVTKQLSRYRHQEKLINELFVLTESDKKKQLHQLDEIKNELSNIQNEIEQLNNIQYPV